MSEDGRLSARIIGQIALMQNVVAQFPDREKMMQFVCHGLKDVSGVARIDYVLADAQGNIPEKPYNRGLVSGDGLRYIARR